MSDDDKDLHDFHIGDADLALLGVAAAVAARYQARRKGSLTRGLPAFPQSDVDAIDLLKAGVEVGGALPLDDVPEVFVRISAQSKVLKWLLDMSRAAEDDDADDDADEPWREP